ncbi:hypothetical protein EX30DRAFT_49142 [Ascodesmis nigricans]|uniref:Myb-like domain-containing protein n=1 Tax=Ascodesmis nigricans TaxID=341454 RepID=A0A4S2MVZ6_9PEZI|nr:hypothetical protein EX30DRAFT_49142 [Ascodesmis nigricans]
MENIAHHRTPPITTNGGAHMPVYGQGSRIRTREQLEFGAMGPPEEGEGDVDQQYQHLPRPPHQHHHQTYQSMTDHAPPRKMPRKGRDLSGNMGSVSPGLSPGGQNSGTGLGVMMNSPQQHHQQMSSPALPARPRGSKMKFTPEDDQKLVELKEKQHMSWKQIAEQFPGRSSGTLQVRYCTKLKAKTTVWTDDSVEKLRIALQEYEKERWRWVAGKVGQSFSANACRDKAYEEGLMMTGPQHPSPPPQHQRQHQHQHQQQSALPQDQVLVPLHHTNHHHHETHPLPLPHPHHQHQT